MSDHKDSKAIRSSKSSDDIAKVKVLVRIRPFIKGDSGTRCVTVDPPAHVYLRNLALKASSEVLQYNFDHCYDNVVGQAEIFDSEVKPLLSKLFKGLNTTIFAYGVTGAGKTHTMQGTEEDPGIIPRAAETLLSLMKSFGSSKVDITASYLEIYNEKVYDLLQPKDQDLPIREDQNKNIFIPNLAEVPIRSFEEFQVTYSSGCKNRTTASTKLNSKSSRSHAILLLKVVHRQGNKILTGKLHLIDLAGSEDNRRTDNTGIRLTESSNINQSLFVLGKVVNALNRAEKRVPYRDSKLTRLLQDSLGGNSYSVMIANVAPGQNFFLDTYNTLNFASKSKLIVNKLAVNESTDKPVIQVDVNIEEDIRKAELAAWKKRKNNNDGLNPKSKMRRQDNKENVPENIIEKFNEKMEKWQQNVEVQMKTLQQQINERKLISPSVRGTLDAKTQSRLERLEQKLVEQVVQSTDLLIQPKELPKKRFKMDNFDLYTPVTKLNGAKECIVRAKKLEADGDLREALNEYRQAALLAPSCQNVKSRIEQLEGELMFLTNEVPPFTPAATAKPAKYSFNTPYNYEPQDEDTDNSAEKKLEFNDAEDEPTVVTKELDELENNVVAEVEDMEITAVAQEDTEHWEYQDDSDFMPTPKAKSKNRRSNENTAKKQATTAVPIDKELLATVEQIILNILNTGNKKEVMALSGIGKQKAEKIMKYRTENTFKSIEDLKIAGFGKKGLTSFVEKNVDVAKVR